MNRKDFIHDSIRYGLGCCVVGVFAAGDEAGAADAGSTAVPVDVATAPAAAPTAIERDKVFTDNWLADLLETMNEEVDESVRIRLMEGCGRGCYRRHRFKQDIAAAAGGTVEGLLAAYQRRWDAWMEGDAFHIRVRSGATPAVCRCPVLRDHPAGTSDLHCHCTKATHQALMEAALGRKVPVEIVDTVRRGGPACHFVARVG